MQNEANFLTITEAAKVLKVSPDTLRRWEEKGIITPQRTKGGSRRYALLDLKIAKLNKRKVRFFQISTLLKQNYINSKRDLKVAFLTSFLWIFGLLSYHFLTPYLSLPANNQQRILSDQLKAQTHLRMASETNPIKAGVINTPIAPGHSSTGYKITSGVSLSSDLLINGFNDSETLHYTDTLNQYYLLKPLPQNQIPTVIKRI